MFLLRERVAKLKRTDMEPSEEAPEKLTIADCLRSWGLEIYIEKFNEHAIDLETLQMLSDADIKDLVPVIGHRAKLVTQINLFKETMAHAFATPNESQENVFASNITLNDAHVMLYTLQGADVTETVTVPEVPEVPKHGDVYEILNLCNEGKGLLLQYQEKGLLNNAARRRLCHIIIENIIILVILFL